jgi:DNA-binding XRE family transcriptional regulator
LTEWQKKEALRLRGKVTKEEIAKRIGASRSSISRLGRYLKLSFNACNKYKANPKFVKEVCDYYAKHGKAKTLERFPGIKLRSIVERYKIFPPRQIRWTDDQLKELARMAGIVSIDAQARYFKRPNANRGSIISAWMKKFKMGGGCINGLSWYMARHFVTRDCKPIRTKFWRQKDGIAHTLEGRQIVLWTEMQKHLKPDSPDWLKESIEAMAKFQIWLHGTMQVKAKVKKVIRRIDL